MDKQLLVAVQATEERFRALRHIPSNAGFDASGKGVWPADQFTFRLRNEGAITIDEISTDAEAVPENASSIAKRK